MRGRGRRRNFWKAWYDEHGSGGHGPGGPPGDPGQWQEYFASFMGSRPSDHWLFKARRFKPWQMGEVMFNPFVSAWLSKSGGLLPLYTMHLLSEAPRYGHEIINVLADRTAEKVWVNPAAVYPLLAEMAERGFVESEWEDDDKRTKRQYTLTETGHEELRRLKAVMRPKLLEAIEVLRDIVDDLSETDDPHETESHEAEETATND